MSFDLTPTDDLRQILDAAQTMLDTHYPVARLRTDGQTDPMEPLAEFGTFLLALPEDAGGAGFSVVEEALLHVSFGRHLVSPSALAMAIAARIALDAGRDDLAAGIGGGQITVCTAIAAPDGPLLCEPAGTTYALVVADDGLTLRPLDGATQAPVTSMGHGRSMTRLTALPDPSTDLRAKVETARLHTLLCAAQLLGIATGARDLAVDYAMTREQFGRPIGSFQAIKHHCADMAIGVEMLSAQLDMAAIAARDGADDAAFQIAALACLAPRIALENARTGIQIHGGIGFSAEADAQLYLKQAHVLRHCLLAGDLLSLPAPMAPFERQPA
ncbi:acyl-CoA dehydrogenase family protein [Chachezhania antarctica]|uniref:acyl-CoA dehydrogenase family protein n=1 Tax=Chachezhania antarctica TaxID=2340860 RepID=UPI0013CEA0A0|nr:acyl-CoA dehydrogenase family protein [Chachezhania antarctica]|tara:strand:+ start:239 stop:1225 length:987 start_codon:yes stop_codon:yes gene_type:complete